MPVPPFGSNLNANKQFVHLWIKNTQDQSTDNVIWLILQLKANYLDVFDWSQSPEWFQANNMLPLSNSMNGLLVVIVIPTGLIVFWDKGV